MDKVLLVDMEKCNGCKICELICSSTHFEEYNPARSHIKILTQPQIGVHYPVLKISCDFCGGVFACALKCPQEALEFVEPSNAAGRMKGRQIGVIPAPVSS
jgi:ferredoxin